MLVDMTLWCLQAAAPAGNGIIGAPSNGGKAANSGTSTSSLVLSGGGVTQALLQRLLEQMHGPEVELKGGSPTPNGTELCTRPLCNATV